MHAKNVHESIIKIRPLIETIKDLFVLTSVYSTSIEFHAGGAEEWAARTKQILADLGERIMSDEEKSNQYFESNGIERHPSEST